MAANVAAKKKTRAKIVTDWRPGAPRITKKNMRDVLLHLCELGNVSEACRRAGCSRRGIYQRADRDEEFGAAFEEARTIGWCGFEDDTFDLAYYGWQEPVFHDGEVCGEKTRHSPALRMFMLKAHKPDVYRDRYDMNLAGVAGAPLLLNVTMDPNVKRAAG